MRLPEDIGLVPYSGLRTCGFDLPDDFQGGGLIESQALLPGLWASRRTLETVQPTVALSIMSLANGFPPLWSRRSYSIW